MDREHGVVGFAFWPWGNPAEEFTRQPLLHDLCSVPQILEANDLLKAPTGFWRP